MSTNETTRAKEAQQTDDERRTYFFHERGSAGARSESMEGTRGEALGRAAILATSWRHDVTVLEDGERATNGSEVVRFEG